MGEINTQCQLAKRRVREIGTSYLSSSGDTLIHMCDTPAMVHIAAGMRVPINAQNFVGQGYVYNLWDVLKCGRYKCCCRLEILLCMLL